MSLTNNFGFPKALIIFKTLAPILPTPINPIVVSEIVFPRYRCHLPLCISKFERWTDRNNEIINPIVNSAIAGVGASGV